MKNKLKFFIFLLCLPILILGLGIFSYPIIQTTSADVDKVGPLDVAPKYISTARDLMSFINNYGLGINDDVANIVLTANINLSEAGRLNYTIGNSELPFRGIFNGNGYAISGIKFDIENTSAPRESYLGLFGYTSGAVIKNLQLAEDSTSGSYEINAKFVATDVYLGLLVGYAENTSISKCYINTSYKFNLSSNGTLQDITNGTTEVNFNSFSFGLLAGSCMDSTITECIVTPMTSGGRQNTKITLGSRNKGAMAYVGGVVGNLINSKFTFVVSKLPVDIVVESYFTSGEIYAGGMIGLVSQQNSIVRNCVSSNPLSYTGNTQVVSYLGNVGGYIGTTYPSRFNISYCYFNNPTMPKSFSNIDSYLSLESINLTSSLACIVASSNDFTTQADYINTSWYNGGFWNFKDVWTINGRNIALQAFTVNNSISVALDSSSYTNESVLVFLDNSNNILYEEEDVIADSLPKDIFFIKSGTGYVESTNQNYSSFSQMRYGTTVAFKFKFNDVKVDEKPFSSFFELSAITLGSERVATFYRLENGSYDCVIAEDNFPDISILIDDNVFTVIINSLTSRYTGSYRVSIIPIDFTGEFTYNLYNSGVLQNEEPKTECYVTYKGDGSRNRSSIITTLNHGGDVSVTTGTNTDSIYVFYGWFLQVDDGEDIFVGDNEEITVVFGSGYFTDNFVLYAKYIDDARVLTFSLGEGIKQLIVGTTANTYDIREDKTISLPKEFATMTISVFTEEGYSFDAETLKRKINDFKSSTNDICEAELKTDEETGVEYYVMTVDLQYLNSEFVNGFLMEFRTNEASTINWGTIGLIIGIVAAAIIAIVVIVVVVMKKRGGGMSGGGGRSMKSSYKGMYY